MSGDEKEAKMAKEWSKSTRKQIEVDDPKKKLKNVSSSTAREWMIRVTLGDLSVRFWIDREQLPTLEAAKASARSFLEEELSAYPIYDPDIYDLADAGEGVPWLNAIEVFSSMENAAAMLRHERG